MFRFWTLRHERGPGQQPQAAADTLPGRCFLPYSSPMRFDPLRALTALAILLLASATAPAQAPRIADPDLECAFRELLQARDDGHRQHHALILSRGGPEGLLLLEKLSLQRRPDVRLAAAQGLRAAGDETTLPALARLSLDRQPEIVREAARGLLGLGDAGRDHLHMVLMAAGDRQWEEVGGLLTAVAATAEPAWTEAIVALLDREEGSVRTLSLNALSGLDPAPTLTERVAPFVVDRNPAVAGAAVRCLDAWIDGRTASLIDLIQGSDPYLADFALISLRRRVSLPFAPLAQGKDWPRVSASLKLATKSPHSLLRLDAIRTLQRWLTNSYAFVEDRSWLPELAALFASETDTVVREACLELLGDAVRRRSGVEGLGGATDLTPESRSLIHFDDDDLIVPVLLSALGDQDVELTGIAAGHLADVLGFGEDWSQATPAERAALRTRWKAEWEQRSAFSTDERTSRALLKAVDSLREGSPPATWGLGFRAVLGRVPPEAGDPAQWLQDLLDQGPRSRLERLTLGPGDEDTGLPDPLTWAMLSRMAGGSLHPLEFLSKQGRAELRERIRTQRRDGPSALTADHVSPTQDERLGLDLRSVTAEPLRSTAVALTTGWHPRLRAQAEQLLERHPELPQAWLLAGLVEVAAANADAAHARACFKRALEAEDAEVRAVAGRNLVELTLTSMDGSARRRELRELTREAATPSIPCWAELGLAEALIEDGRERTAGRRLSRADSEPCGHQAPWRWAAAEALSNGDTDAALAVLAIEADAEPASVALLRARARALAGDAERGGEEALGIERLLRIGRAALEPELAPPSSLDEARALSEDFPESAIAAGWLGRLELANGRAGPGILGLERSLRSGGRDPAIFLPLLRAQARTSRCEEALDTLWLLHRDWPRLLAVGSKAAQSCLSKALLEAREAL